MEWIDILAEWVLFPLLIVYGIVSWAKDHPNVDVLDPFKTEDEKRKPSPDEHPETKETND